MYLNSFSAVQSRLRTNAFSSLIILVYLVSYILSGCSSQSIFPISTDTEETALPFVDKKVAFNKPYKVRGKTYFPLDTASGYKARGIASWYGAESGNRTSSGDRFNPRGLTAAHKTLPIPSKVRVTNIRNGRSVDVIINDRGPFKRNRLIDLSQGAAEHIGLKGLAEVTVEYIGG